MRLFHCAACRTPVQFSSFYCPRCGLLLGFAPEQRRMLTFMSPLVSHTAWVPARTEGPPLRPCANRLAHGVCNWMVEPGHGSHFCASCRLNAHVVDPDAPGQLAHWAAVEGAKRRALYELRCLGLMPTPKTDAQDRLGLVVCIDDPGCEQGTPLHEDGVINLAPAQRTLGRPWPDLLAQVRHGLALYLHHRWVLPDKDLQLQVRAMFGDTTAPAPQQQSTTQGASTGWRTQYISELASLHPLQDWAQTCAHTLMVLDALDTAEAWGLQLTTPRGAVRLNSLPAPAGLRSRLLQHWQPLAQCLNALAHSAGLADPYPAMLPELVRLKMTRLVDLLEKVAARHTGAAAWH